jgi:hypothetical protein
MKIYSHNNPEDWLKMICEGNRMKLYWKKSILLYDLDNMNVYKEIFYSGNWINKILQFLRIKPFYERLESVKYEVKNTKLER